MDYDKFKLIYEDIMSDTYNIQDDIICEEKKPWTLKDDLLAIWPLIQEKFDSTFSDFFGNKLPGEPEYDPDSVNVTGINIGSDNPGYIVRLKIDDLYAKTLIKPFYKALQIKRSFNNPLAPYVDKLMRKKKLNMMFEFFMYVKQAKAEDYDAKYDYKKTEKIEKHTISGWDGTGFVNFDLESLGGPRRNSSKLKICSLEVSFKNYQSLLSKLAEMNRKNHVWSQDEVFGAIGSVIRKGFHKLATSGKKNKVKAKFKFGSGLSNTRDVNIKITMENYKIDESETLTLDTYKSEEDNAISEFKPQIINEPKLRSEIGNDWKKQIAFRKDKLDRQYQLSASLKDSDHWIPVVNNKEDEGRTITDNDSNMVGKFEMEINNDVSKIYNVFINLEDWKKNQKDSSFLWQKNSVKPIIRVNIKSRTTKNDLLSYKLTIDELKKYDNKAYDYIKSVINTLTDM